jgi:hypothetical protein
MVAEDSARHFGVSGNSIATLWAPIPPRFYPVLVRINARSISVSDDTSFVISGSGLTGAVP